MDQERQFDLLVGQIYDAGLDPARWPEVVEAVRAAINGKGSSLLHRDGTLAMRSCDFSAVSWWTAEMLAPYHEYYGSLDLRVPAVARLPIGQVYVDDRELAFEEVAASEIFNDFYRPLGVGHALGVNLFSGADRASIFSVHRAIEHGAFQPEEVSFFERLAPHVLRSLQLQRQVGFAFAVADGVALALDHFPTAVFLVDRTGTVLEANTAAARLLASPLSPLRVIGGQLRATLPNADNQLRGEIIKAADSAAGRSSPPTSIFRLAKTDGHEILGIMVAPIRQGDVVGARRSPAALVFASDPTAAVQIDAEALRSQFGFTAAEAALAAGLVSGDGLADIGAGRQVSQNTVRTQLKSLMAKTDTHSQGQLISLIARSLSLLRR